MAKTAIAQTNFTSGELSPKLYGRGDASNYQNGAEIVENAIVSVHGGLDRRDGLAYVRAAKLGAAARVRIIPYVFNESQAFLVELGVGYARFYTAEGALLVDGALAPLEVVTPYTEAQLPQVQYTQGADTMLLFHPDVPVQRLRRLTNSQWQWSPAQWIVEPFAEKGHRPDQRLYLAGLSGTQVFSTVDVDFPDPPTNVVATALNTAARVTFDAPADTGGKPILGYEVTSSPGGITMSGPRSPIVIPGLANGTAYTFTVVAKTVHGPSVPSAASNSVTPSESAASPTLTVNFTPDAIDTKVPNGRVAVTGPTASAPNGAAPVSYVWTLLSGSGGVELTGRSGATPTLRSTAHNNINFATLRCTAVDANGATGVRDCNVTIRHDSSVQLQ